MGFHPFLSSWLDLNCILVTDKGKHFKQEGGNAVND